MTGDRSPRRPARLPPDGEQGKLLLPGGEVMPVRVAESGDGMLRLVYLLAPQDPLPHSGEEPPLLEWSSARGIVRLAGKVVWEDRDLVRFEVSDMVDLQQRREHVRVHAPRPVVLEFADERELGTFAIDLSGGGILLAGPDVLEVGDHVRFRLLLDGSAQAIEGSGHVVRYGPGGYRAIAFEDVSESDRERLIRFIFEFERRARNVRSDSPRGSGDGQG